ncbi:hypothetical protein QBC34DRAFT_413304 [Podospora aff. communis PSN243]|uniref:Uncharacterized protein n=1 Tax=Podospora aff. communis PSN243 TaxID=3040156 RepID=A0AAV9G919_9PEZI|nr:hypothetical protein QBC34DRAFT_413304 [Podospora aff. communis PSN243]
MAPHQRAASDAAQGSLGPPSAEDPGHSRPVQDPPGDEASLAAQKEPEDALPAIHNLPPPPSLRSPAEVTRDRLLAIASQITGGTDRAGWPGIPTHMMRQWYEDVVEEKWKLSRQLQRLEEEHKQTKAALRREIAQLQQANMRIKWEKDETLRLAKAHSQRLEKDQDERIRTLEAMKAERGKKPVEFMMTHSAAKAIINETKTFASSASASSASNDDVKAWFSRQTQDWYDWAKDFSHRDPARIEALLPSERREFLAAISPFVALEEGELPKEICGKGKMSYVLLQALLADFVCKEAFKSPFWVLDAMQPSVAGSTGGATAKDGLADLYGELMTEYDRNAHQWRSIMMRIIAVNGMCEMKNLKGESAESRPYAAARRTYSEGLTRRFLKGPARFLLSLENPSQHSNCSKRLGESIEKMLQFSAGLWSRRSFINSLSLEHFQTANQGRFSSDMKNAELYQSDELEQPSTCEGAQIIMVVLPAVIACRTEQGQNCPAVWRPWMKAQLLVPQSESYR